jgi:1-phosphatidylinositol-4-phosphate 5-kinase
VKSKGRRAYLVVINNVFPASKDIHQTFDLKGSTVGREFDEEKLKENPRRPLKDLNWIRRGMCLEFGPRKKELLLTQITKDVNFLSSLNVMDYSLLLGIHYVSRGNAENIRSTTLSMYQPGSGLQRASSKRKAGRDAFYNVERRRLSVSGGADAILPTEEFLERKLGLFTSEEGGFYATNDQDQPTGDIIYYFGVIDFLTTVSIICNCTDSVWM